VNQINLRTPQMYAQHLLLLQTVHSKHEVAASTATWRHWVLLRFWFYTSILQNLTSGVFAIKYI